MAINDTYDTINDTKNSPCRIEICPEQNKIVRSYDNSENGFLQGCEHAKNVTGSISSEIEYKNEILTESRSKKEIEETCASAPDDTKNIAPGAEPCNSLTIDDIIALLGSGWWTYLIFAAATCSECLK